MVILFQIFRPGPLPQKIYTPSDSFAARLHVPKKVNALLQSACYDCHSYNTRYPWYAKIQPFYSLMYVHSKEGEKSLNFDLFGQYSKRKQRSKIQSMHSQIADGLMPLRSYIIMHPEAKLTAEDKKELLDWLEMIQDSDVLF